MSNVMACIDGSANAPAVCDYAAWASLNLDAPLSFLHMLDSARYPTSSQACADSGSGSDGQPLAYDAQRAALAREEGRLMLEAASRRACAAGVVAPQLRQRHGELADALRELEDDIRLLVIGRQGEASGNLGLPLGSQLESVIRTLQRPVLVCPQGFKEPQSLLLAWDGSATSQRAVDLLSGSPLLVGLPCHLVLVGEADAGIRAQLDTACSTLRQSGYPVSVSLRTGEADQALLDYQAEYDLDLLVMGAYGHSRIRQYLVGSTTSNLLRCCPSPLLILR